MSVIKATFSVENLLKGKIDELINKTSLDKEIKNLLKK